MKSLLIEAHYMPCLEYFVLLLQNNKVFIEAF